MPGNQIDLISAVPENKQSVRGYNDYYSLPCGKRLNKNKIPENVWATLNGKGYRSVAFVVMSPKFSVDIKNAVQ